MYTVSRSKSASEVRFHMRQNRTFLVVWRFILATWSGFTWGAFSWRPQGYLWLLDFGSMCCSSSSSITLHLPSIIMADVNSCSHSALQLHYQAVFSKPPLSPPSDWELKKAQKQVWLCVLVYVLVCLLERQDDRTRWEKEEIAEYLL